MHRLIPGAALAAVLCGAAAAAEAPKTFVTHAIQGDNAEIRIGELAQQKGATEGVRNFGQTLVTDHTKARKEMTDVATRLGVSGAAAEPKKTNPDTYTKLSGLSGPAFDRAFVSDMVADHKKDIADFQAEADAGSGPASKIAAQQLPTLKKHLAIAERLQKAEPQE